MIRLCLVITILATIQAGALYIGAGYTPPTIAPAEATLQNIPQTIETWTSSDVELDPQVYVAIGASDTIDRQYVNAAGSPVLAHCSGWNDGEEWMPHPPQLCYSNAGWEIKKQEPISLDEFPDSKLCLMELERQGERLLVLYWFQRGEFTYHDRDGARVTRQNLWGRPVWPPLVKVLLQAQALDKKAAEKNLRTIARHVLSSINKENHSPLAP